jgi:hypothetical protein
LGTMDAEYELSAKQVERSVLEAELDTEELWNTDEYQRLTRQIETLKEKVADDQPDSESAEAETLVFQTDD